MITLLGDLPRLHGHDTVALPHRGKPVRDDDHGAALCDLAQPPTGLVASNDQMALAALRVASQRGLSVPHDLSIVSFDDTPIVKFSHPALTAITQPIAAMTAAAANLLIRAKSGETDLPTRQVLPFGLVARGSSAPPRL